MESLETARLRLRRFTAADVENLVVLDGDPEVMRFLNGGTPTARATVVREVLPRFLREGRDDGTGFWAAERQAERDFIGWFSLRRCCEAPGEAEIGFRLLRAVWGRGYATEGVRALIARGFGELGLDRIVGTTYQDNLASRRVMEKAGLRLVRRYRFSPAEVEGADTYQPATGEPWDGDDLVFAITR